MMLGEAGMGSSASISWFKVGSAIMAVEGAILGALAASSSALRFSSRKA